MTHTPEHPPLIPTINQPGYDPATAVPFRDRFQAAQGDWDPQLCLDLGFDRHGVHPSTFTFPIPADHTWLWRSHLPANAVTLLEGESQSGKTLFALDLAARVSAGLPLPDGSPSAGLPLPDGSPFTAAPVFYISSEDDPSSMLLPTLLQAGANPDWVFFWQFHLSPKPQDVPPSEQGFTGTPQDIERLHHAMSLIQPRLVIIDSLGSTLGCRSKMREEDVADFLFTLLQLASLHQCTFLLIRNRNTPLMDRVQTRVERSPHLLRSSRATLLLTTDPEHPSDRLLSFLKHTRAAAPATLRFTITTPDGNTVDDPPQLVWQGTHEASARELSLFQSHGMTPEGQLRREVLALLREHAPTPLTTRAIRTALGLSSRNTLNKTLSRLYKAGLVTRSDLGQYTIPSPNSSASQIPTTPGSQHEEITVSPVSPPSPHPSFDTEDELAMSPVSPVSPLPPHYADDASAMSLVSPLPDDDAHVVSPVSPVSPLPSGRGKPKKSASPVSPRPSHRGKPKKFVSLVIPASPLPSLTPNGHVV